MKKYLAFYENEWPANIAELTAVENKPFVGYLKGQGVQFTVVPPPTPETWKIYYTSTDGNVVTPNKTDVFGANIVSNTYENGKGVIEFDNSVTSIGRLAFKWCSSLTSIVIPDDVTSIELQAFADCSSLTSVTIGNSVTSIGEDAFWRCSSLTSITIPNSVMSLGYQAFYDCSLSSITIPNSLTTIGKSAFSNCRYLISIIIGNSVTSIRDSAFRSCSSLTSITFEGTVEQWNIITKDTDWNYNVPATYVQCSDGQVTL